MATWNDERTSSGIFLLGAVAGALVGAGLALLMAPKAGAQVRQDLSSGFNSVRDAAAKRYRDLAEKASAKMGKTDGPVDQFAARTSAMGDTGTLHS